MVNMLSTKYPSHPLVQKISYTINRLKEEAGSIMVLKASTYVQSVFEHYRCLKYYLSTTRMEIISNTVCFIPTHIPTPEVKFEKYLKAASNKQILLLQKQTTTYPEHKLTLLEIHQSNWPRYFNEILHICQTTMPHRHLQPNLQLYHTQLLRVGLLTYQTTRLGIR